MKSNNPRALLKNLVKQNNAAATASGRKFDQINTELAKLEANDVKLVTTDGELHEQEVATRNALAALEGQAPAARARNKPNPEYITWKQNVSALKKKRDAIVGKRTTVRGKLEGVRSKKKSLANIHGSTNVATGQYQNWANEASRIQGIRSRTEKMKQTKALLKEIRGN